MIFNKKLLLMLLPVLSNYNPIAAEEVNIIQEVKVSGLTKISPNLIEKNLKDEILNKPFTAQLMNRITSNLLLSELFSSIDFKYDDGSLEIIIIENPIVKEVKVKSNSLINLLFNQDNFKNLLEQSGIKAGFRLINLPPLKAVAHSISSFVRSQTNIDTNINIYQENLPEGEVNIIIDVQESTPINIKKIIFLGNKKVDSKTLYSCIEEIPSILNLFKFSPAKFNEARLANIQEQIISFYKDRGFLDANITSVEVLIDDDRDACICLTISEGKRFSIAHIRTAMNLIEPELEEEVKQLIKIREGEEFSASKLNALTRDILQYLRANNFVGSKVLTSIIRGEETVDIMLNVDKGAFSPLINNIKIHSDSIATHSILSRLLQHEGDFFDFNKHQAFLNNLRNLPIIKSVDDKLELGEEGKIVDITYIIKADEKTRRLFSANFNWAGFESWAGNVALSDLNFLSSGYAAKISAGVSNKEWAGDISFDVNDILPRLNASFEAGIAQINSPKQERGPFDFDSGSNKINLAAKFKINSLFDIPLNLTFNNYLQKKFFSNTFNPASYLARKQLLGKKDLTSYKLKIGLESKQKDRFFFPTSGFSFNVAGSLINQDRFVTAGLESNLDGFISPVKWSSMSLAISIKYVRSLQSGREVFESDLVQGGGLSTIRGFGDNSLGALQRSGLGAILWGSDPLEAKEVSFDGYYSYKDSKGSYLEVVGGDLSIFARAELNIPISLDVNKFDTTTPYSTFFIDAGNVFYLDPPVGLLSEKITWDCIRASAGFQINIPTGFLGNIKFGLALPVLKKENDAFSYLFIGLNP